MTQLLRLHAHNTVLVLAPVMGGGIARLDIEGKPVLRPWSGRQEEGPFALASNILVPFSNRVDGGFEWAGQWRDIPPNRAGKELPVHGDGFAKPWHVQTHSATSATLVLEAGAIGPFIYRATQKFTLSAQRLRIDLSITNTGPEALPFGCGFHPWFPRNAETRLQFDADGVWTEDDRHLSGEHLRVGEHEAWDFHQFRALPDNLVNNAWTGWSRTAHITQNTQFASVSISTEEKLTCAIIYSDDKDCDFVCFEPVSHPVNAHNMPNKPGLTVLAPGQEMRTWMQLDF